MTSTCPRVHCQGIQCNEDHRRGTLEIIRAIASILSRIPRMHTYACVSVVDPKARRTPSEHNGMNRLNRAQIWWRIPSPVFSSSRIYFLLATGPHVHACIPYPITSRKGVSRVVDLPSLSFRFDPLAESKLFEAGVLGQWSAR